MLIAMLASVGRSRRRLHELED